MKARYFKYVLLAVVAAILLGACRSNQPVLNIANAPVSARSSDYTLEDMDNAITQAGIAFGWEMRPVQPGHMVGTLRIRDHVAVVDIQYNTQTYNIRYKNSTNLKYDGTNIHPNYNGWIQNLNNAIASKFAGM